MMLVYRPFTLDSLVATERNHLRRLTNHAEGSSSVMYDLLDEGSPRFRWSSIGIVARTIEHGTPMGWAAAWWTSSPNHMASVGVYVHPNHRLRNYGTELAEHLVRAVRGLGLFPRAFPGTPQGKAFYRKVGIPFDE